MSIANIRRGAQCHRRRLLPAMIMLLVQCLTCSPIAVASMVAEIDVAVRTADLSGGTVALRICDAHDGTELMALNADRPMLPASNMKVLTSGAALHTLGPEFHFNTRLLLVGDTLILQGDGDPALADPELLEAMTVDGEAGLDVETFLEIWVNAVKAADVSTLDAVVVDDRIFDRQYVHPSWPIEQLNTRSFAEISGANFHLNVLHFYAMRNDAGRPNLTNVQPRVDWIIPRNRATCRTRPSDSNTLWFARARNTNDLTAYGNVKSRQVFAPVTIHDPPEFLAHLLTERLRDAGIEVKSFRAATSVDPAVDDDATLLEPVVRTPLPVALQRCNTDSQNLYAECLLKRIGHARTGQPGSWNNGAGIVRLVIHERLGSDVLSSGVVISDGSGLSRDNRVTAHLLSDWLHSFYTDERLRELFVNSLANASGTGTLEKRFRSVELHGATVKAKTGFINGVSCLSGYVIMPDGQARCYSILVNDLPAHKSVYPAKRLQEQIVSIIAKDMAEQAARHRVTVGGE
jgi:D-alanyl-D-alanine carboxypeptidase/D-alanyl-D-alanine-endopeptidase (penicillin-binding protein 4)